MNNARNSSNPPERGALNTSRLMARRAILDDISHTQTPQPTDIAHQPQVLLGDPELDATIRRYQSVQPLWPAVLALQSLITSNVSLQNLVKTFRLTRNKQLDHNQHQQFRTTIFPFMSAPESGLRSLSGDQADLIIDVAYDELVGISVLGPLWRDDTITEIMVDAWNKVRVERHGKLFETPISFRDHAHGSYVARQLAAMVADRKLAPSLPAVTADLEGARATFVVAPIAKSGLAFTIRKFMPLLNMEALLATSAMSPEMRQFLADAVHSRATVLVSGGTGTGKTTMINALSESIPNTERVVSIEDSYELQLANTHWVPLQTKEAASADDQVRVSMADLLVVTLRMRPDRVIVGEIREAAAAAVMLQAANTGHDGTMTTIHASSADQALFRLAGWARASGGLDPALAAYEVATAIDVVVQVERSATHRFISHITEVDTRFVTNGQIISNPLFTGKMSDNPDHAVPVFTQVGIPGGDTTNNPTQLALKLSRYGRLERWRR